MNPRIKDAIIQNLNDKRLEHHFYIGHHLRKETSLNTAHIRIPKAKLCDPAQMCLPYEALGMSLIQVSITQGQILSQARITPTGKFHNRREKCQKTVSKCYFSLIN